MSCCCTHRVGAERDKPPDLSLQTNAAPRALSQPSSSLTAPSPPGWKTSASDVSEQGKRCALSTEGRCPRGLSGTWDVTGSLFLHWTFGCCPGPRSQDWVPEKSIRAAQCHRLTKSVLQPPAPRGRETRPGQQGVPNISAQVPIF